MLKYYDFSGVSFLVEKSFECENASENAAARFVQPGTLIQSRFATPCPLFEIYKCFPYLNISKNPHIIRMGEARNRGASIVSRIYRPTM
jgi:hypothetical protein